MQNKKHQVVEQCRLPHNGTQSTEGELDEVLKKLPDEKCRRKTLILEVRYRRLTIVLDDSFPVGQFYMQCYVPPFRLDRNTNGVAGFSSMSV